MWRSMKLTTARYGEMCRHQVKIGRHFFRPDESGHAFIFHDLISRTASDKHLSHDLYPIKKNGLLLPVHILSPTILR
ncbi:hypothetical protein MRB53_037434 [Persea americana]|nr:hypothetical protein MRB53_037434 [Persea americana]